MYRIIQQLMKWSWKLLTSSLCALILAMALSRLLFTGLPLVQQTITDILSKQLNANLTFEYMYSDWQGGEPALSIRGLTLQGKDADSPGFHVNRFDMELDLRASLLKWTLIFKKLQVDGINLYLVQGDGASWSLRGIDEVAGSSSTAPVGGRGRLLDWLNLQTSLDIKNVQLDILQPDGQSTSVSGRYLALTQDGKNRKLSARLEVGDGFLEVKGDGALSSRWSTSWRGVIQADGLDAEKFCALWSGCYDNLGASRVKVDVSWEYQDGLWQVYGPVTAPQLDYRDTNGNWRQLSASSDLFIQGQRGVSWQIWLNDLNLSNEEHDGQTWQWTNSWYLSGRVNGDYEITVGSDQIDLYSLKRWLLDAGMVPESIADLIKTLNPYGYLNEVALRFYPGRKPFDIDLSATLKDVSVDAWEGAPSGGNVNGQVRMGLLKGYLDLDTENLSLGLTKLFREVWYYDSAKGRLYWDVVDDTYILKSDDLALTGPEGNLKGKLRLDIPMTWDEGETLDMALTVGITDGDARYTAKYLPSKLPMDENMVSWLDNGIKAGKLKSGGFLYNGALVEGVRAEDSRWGLYFDIEQGQISYAPEWPEVSDMNAQVFVNDDGVDVQVSNAKSADGKLQNVQVKVPLNNKPIIDVSGTILADGKTVKRFLTQTPIDEAMNGEARGWDIGGQINADLNLKLPLNNMNKYDFALNAKIESGRFAIPSANIEVQNLHGPLSVSTKKGLQSSGLAGDFLGYPTEFEITSIVNRKQTLATNIGLKGRISILRLQQWLGFDWLSLLEGETGYQANLNLALAARQVDFTVNSDLQGLEIELPAPLAKPANKMMPFSLKYSVAGGQQLYAELGDLGRASLQMSPNNTLDSAAIALGIDAELPNAAKGEIRVTGALRELDLEPWQQRFGDQPGNTEEQKVASRLIVDQVRIDELRYGDYRWSDMSVSLGTGDEGISLSATGRDIDGTLLIPSGIDVPYRLTMNKLILPETSAASDPKTDTVDADVLADVNPSFLPEVDVDIRSLQLGKKPPGALSFKVRRADNGVRIDDIFHSMGEMKLTGFADWVQADNKQQSWFQGRIEGKGVDQLLKSTGLQEVVSAERTQIDLNLNWPGSLMGARFKEMKGGIELDMEDGRIKQSDAKTGALKLFGILNVETFQRRLQLDFSDLYSSGIAFDQFSGAVRLDSGVITFDKPIIIDGPSSSFKLDGSANVNKKSLDMELVVTLPVTSNLPILSVLLGSSPQLAGIIFIADKLVGKQVDQLASIRYRILGTFDDPDITLDQLFSGKKKGKAEGGSR